MTTKKQKHQAAMQKRARWIEEQKESGLKAQKADQEHRDNQRRDAAREKHNKEHSWKQLDRDCILCKDLLSSHGAARKGDA